MAAENGELEVLKWAHSHGCPWQNTYDCFSAAFTNNHKDILSWFVSVYCPWSAETCARAAKDGDFALLKWLHQNFCPWDETTCANAAEIGRADILKWARDNGCPSERYAIDDRPDAEPFDDM
jgi:hypothetical protein